VSETDHSPRSFARAFTSLSLASGVSMGANLVRGKLAALFLGPAGVGVFNQLALMWNLFQIGGSLGAFNGLVQHGTEAMVAKDDLALRRLSSTWWILLTAFSCVLAAAGALGSPTISNWLLSDGGKHAGLVALMLVSVPFASSAQVYRALLSSSRAISHLVRAQIVSDVGGAVVFVLLLPVFGLPGAIAGFASIHLLFYVLTAVSVRKTLGRDFVRPRTREFRWTLVRSNLGYGASGLIMIALSNVSIIMVSRMIIDRFGLDASGIFSNAWRIASVYLGAVTTATMSYYLPTLTRAETNQQMSREVNTTVRFYLFVMPPIMAAIMAAGEPIVWLILSRDFLPVAPLLLLFVPAELMRVLADTITVSLMARRRMLPFTMLFAFQTAIFVVGAYVGLPYLGLPGAACAYGLATTAAAIAAFVTCRSYVALRFERATAIALFRAAALLVAVMVAGFLLPFGLRRLLIVAAASLVWVLWSLRDDGAKAAMSRLAKIGSRDKQTKESGFPLSPE
jgi:enterobacterial common antigen flippase